MTRQALGLQVAHKLNASLEPWPRRFWESATCVRDPSRLTATAAELLKAAPEGLAAALCAAHPALITAAAPLLRVLVSVPSALDSVACQRALSLPKQGPGAGAPLLHVQFSAKSAPNTRWSSASASLEQCPSLRLTPASRSLATRAVCTSSSPCCSTSMRAEGGES